MASKCSYCRKALFLDDEPVENAPVVWILNTHEDAMMVLHAACIKDVQKWLAYAAARVTN